MAVVDRVLPARNALPLASIAELPKGMWPRIRSWLLGTGRVLVHGMMV